MPTDELPRFLRPDTQKWPHDRCCEGKQDILRELTGFYRVIVGLHMACLEADKN